MEHAAIRVSRVEAAPTPTVDDNPINQEVFMAMLGKFGYRADMAINGIQAVTATGVRDYAAVLMDCYLLEMDGDAATAAIRIREGTSRAPRSSP